ncbi:MAG: competence/damage-inducible protein A [Legionellaceae bacterium]|nr:competence/damage-inducible protein A [Legionellaceae bacterium]
MSIAVLATGDELTHGDTLNTTSQALARAFSSAGFSMGMHVVCGDKETELRAAIAFLAASHDTLILTGGLGPTSDDRTRFALAHYLGVNLVSYAKAMQHIEARLALAHLKPDSGQEVQALFPEGALLFDNLHGTAMGCAYQHNGQLFVLLPGPPKECLPMFEAQAFPYLKQQLTPSDKVCLKWQLFGVPEGATAKRVEALLEGIPCQVGYRLDRSENPYLEVKVRCNKESVSRVKVAIEPLAKVCT